MGENLMANTPIAGDNFTLRVIDVSAELHSGERMSSRLEKISFSIKRGEIYGLVCENSSEDYIIEKLLTGDKPDRNWFISSGTVRFNDFNIYFNLEQLYRKNKERKGRNAIRNEELKKFKNGINLTVKRHVSIIHENFEMNLNSKSTALNQIATRLIEQRMPELSDSIFLRKELKEEQLLTFMQEVQFLWGKKRDDRISEFAAEHGLIGFSWLISEYSRNFYDPEISTSWLYEKMKCEIDNKTVEYLKTLSSYKRSGENIDQLFLDFISIGESENGSSLSDMKLELRKKQKQFKGEYRTFQFLLNFATRALMNELKKEAKLWIENQMLELGIEHPDTFLNKTVDNMSPGEAQLCSFVMNTIYKPELVIVEQEINSFGPISNASVRKYMVNMTKMNGTSFLVLARNLSQIRDICHRIGIIYAGRMVEEGLTQDVVSDPKHPLTLSINAVTNMVETGTRDESYRVYIQGTMPSPDTLPSGCYFQPRCKFSLDTCSTRRPVLSSQNDHKVACFLYSQEFEVQQ